MKRLVLSAILALGVTSGARGQTVSLVNPSVLNGVGDVLVYLDKCGDLHPGAKIIWLNQLNKMIDYFGGDRVLDGATAPRRYTIVLARHGAVQLATPTPHFLTEA
jgi:hypothetical protein